MKAITLHQPWASLVALGEKGYETRDWAVRFTGDMAIHAARKRDRDVEYDFNEPEVRAAFAKHGINSLDQLPFGAVICIVYHEGCYRAEDIPPRERRLGNFAPGRIGWKMVNVRVFETPVPAIGQQGVWDWKGSYTLAQPKPARLPDQEAEPPMQGRTYFTGERLTWADRARATGIYAYTGHGDTLAPEDTLAMLYNAGTHIPIDVDMTGAIRAFYKARAVAKLRERRDYIKKFREHRVSEATATSHITRLSEEVRRMDLAFWLSIGERIHADRRLESRPTHDTTRENADQLEMLLT